MDITKLSLEQLKATAYDILIQLEQGQKNLQMINQEIAKKSTEPKKDEKS